MISRVLLLLALALQPVALTAGDIVNCFNRGLTGGCSREVLAHVKFKSVILQYVDPGETRLGEGMSRVLWREILESISDLDDAGVVLAYDRQGQIEEALGEGDLAAFLNRDYHAAAMKIAEQQKVQIAIWGALLRDGDNIFLQNFLTLRETDEDPWNRLSLKIRSNDMEFSTVLARTRINLPALTLSPEEFARRSFNTRCNLRAGCPEGIELRSGPDNHHAVIDHVETGARIRTVDMQQQWFRVERVDETEAWINLYHLEMFPETVWYNQVKTVNLRRGPMGEKLATVSLDGRYDVLDARRYGDFGEPWYQIRVGDRVGWVASRIAHRRSYLFPSVHLIAGLYRYGRSQLDRAVTELEAFIEITPPENNVTLATAHKLLAASRLTSGFADPGTVGSAIRDLDVAKELTPFDASVYSLRAFVQLGMSQTFPDAIKDLQHAIELNPRDTDALNLSRAVLQNTQRGDLGDLTRRVEETRSQLYSLDRKIREL